MDNSVFYYFERTGINLPCVRCAVENTLHFLDKWERNSSVKIEEEQGQMICEVEGVLEDMWEGGMLALEEKNRSISPNNHITQLFPKKRYAFSLYGFLRDTDSRDISLAGDKKLYDWLVTLLRLRRREEFSEKDIPHVHELKNFLGLFRDAIIKESSRVECAT